MRHRQEVRRNSSNMQMHYVIVIVVILLSILDLAYPGTRRSKPGPSRHNERGRETMANLELTGESSFLPLNQLPIITQSQILAAHARF